MPNAWVRFARVAGAVFAVFALLGLIPHVQHGVNQGWPGGLPYLWATLASWFGGLHWYLPVAALAGGVALADATRVRRRPRLLELLLAAVFLASLSFALRGFIGPHLEYFARVHLLEVNQAADVAATLRPNDWSYRRRLAAEGAQEYDVAGILAMVHSTVAFAILSGIMLPLGVAIGNGSRRFLGTSQRRAAWAMAAGTTAVVYGAQIGAWIVVTATGAWPASLVYLGFLTVPLVILMTLVWSGAARPMTGLTRDSHSPGTTP